MEIDNKIFVILATLSPEIGQLTYNGLKHQKRADDSNNKHSENTKYMVRETPIKT